MSAGTVAEEKPETATARAGEQYQCCFCGEGIAPQPPDVCALILHTAFQHGVSEETQTFFCHAACLKQHLDPSIPTIL